MMFPKLSYILYIGNIILHVVFELDLPPNMCYQHCMKVCTLASGSKGNCIYVEGGGARILVDAGLTMRETKERLARIGVRSEELTAVVVTHEHTDHIKGIGPLCRAYGLPVYMTAGTHKAALGWLGKRLS